MCILCSHVCLRCVNKATENLIFNYFGGTNVATFPCFNNNLNEYLKVPSCLTNDGHIMSPNFGIGLVGSWTLPEVPLLISLIFYFTYLLMNDSNISHQRFTVVVPCSKSTHSTHWLFLNF